MKTNEEIHQDARIQAAVFETIAWMIMIGAGVATVLLMVHS